MSDLALPYIISLCRSSGRPMSTQFPLGRYWGTPGRQNDTSFYDSMHSITAARLCVSSAVAWPLEQVIERTLVLQRTPARPGCSSRGQGRICGSYGWKGMSLLSWQGRRCRREIRSTQDESTLADKVAVVGRLARAVVVRFPADALPYPALLKTKTNVRWVILSIFNRPMRLRYCIMRVHT